MGYSYSEISLMAHSCNDVTELSDLYQKIRKVNIDFPCVFAIPFDKVNGIFMYRKTQLIKKY